MENVSSILQEVKLVRGALVIKDQKDIKEKKVGISYN